MQASMGRESTATDRGGDSSQLMSQTKHAKDSAAASHSSNTAACTARPYLSTLQAAGPCWCAAWSLNRACMVTMQTKGASCCVDVSATHCLCNQTTTGTCERSRMESSPFAQPKARRRALGASARVVISAEPVAAAAPCTQGREACLILWTGASLLMVACGTSALW